MAVKVPYAERLAKMVKAAVSSADSSEGGLIGTKVWDAILRLGAKNKQFDQKALLEKFYQAIEKVSAARLARTAAERESIRNQFRVVWKTNHAAIEKETATGWVSVGKTFGKTKGQAMSKADDFIQSEVWDILSARKAGGPGYQRLQEAQSVPNPFLRLSRGDE